MKQIILKTNKNYEILDDYLKSNNCKKILIVFEKIIKSHPIYNYFNELKVKMNIDVIFFDDFTPNPLYESVCSGIKIFKENQCDSIIAIGGGSAMDVAKCIKLYSSMDENMNYLEQKVIPNNIQLLAIPTTAGTGSEATKFAVIYYNGEKQSISDTSCIPSTVLFDASLLKTLPLYQKKSTVLDAFSHSIESIWSVNSTDESKEYAKKAIELITNNMKSYFNGDEDTNDKMLLAANYAGKAINISQTTAGHAMCYKLTSLYKISHGHAAALVNSELLPYMIDHIENCIDSRGKEYILNIFNSIAKMLKCEDNEQLKNYFRNLLKELELYNVDIDYTDINTLVKSVNTVRLKNHPIKLNEDDIRQIYMSIFKRIKECKK